MVKDILILSKIFKNISLLSNFHKTPPSGSRADVSGQTDGHDKVAMGSSRLLERARKYGRANPTAVMRSCRYTTVTIFNKF